jgi:BirA family biotin operon repressor/biotin-[acetyl-CoA-carboxylase] ligase
VSLRILTGRRHDVGRVRDRLLGALDAGYRELRARGGAGLLAAWRRRSVTLGARVRTADGREGMAEDVDEAGALIVRTEDGRRLRVTAGEITGAPAA